MAAQLYIKLCSLSYDGEGRGFSFQKFVNFHKGQHIISGGLMEYQYSGVDENSMVCMLMNGINTNAPDAYKEAILVSLEMQGGFDIAARNIFGFIAITPSIQKNSTAKLSSVIRSGLGRGGGRGSDRGSVMNSESDVQAAMVTIKNKYFRGYERDMSPL